MSMGCARTRTGASADRRLEHHPLSLGDAPPSSAGREERLDEARPGHRDAAADGGHPRCQLPGLTTNPIVPEVAPPITTPGCDGSLVTASIRSPGPGSWPR